MRKFATRDRWTNKEDKSTITSQSTSGKVRKEVAHSKLLRLVEMFVKSYDELKTCDVVTFIKLIMTFYSRILNVDNENSSP